MDITFAREDLATCHSILSGNPRISRFLPALVTMRRHAKAGLLRECEAPGLKKRPLYEVAKVQDHYCGSRKEKKEDNPVGPSAAEGAGEQRALSSIHDTAFTQHLARQSDSIASLQDQIRDMSQVILVLQREVQGLNAVRQSLMSKYDSSHAGAVAMVSTLREQAGRGASVDHSLILGVMQNDLKIVKNSINDLVGQLRAG